MLCVRISKLSCIARANGQPIRACSSLYFIFSLVTILLSSSQLKSASTTALGNDPLGDAAKFEATSGDNSLQTMPASEKAKTDQDTILAKSICADKKVGLTSSKQVLLMIQMIVSQPDKDKICKSRYMASLNELDPILKFSRDEMCSERAFNLIKDYHFRHIQPFEQANRRPSQFEPLPRELIKAQLYADPRKYTVEFDEQDQPMQTPIAIRHFFLKFALEVSLVCKRDMLNNLSSDSQRILSEDDRAIMLLFDKDTPIGQALMKPLESVDFDSVLYMAELDGELKGSAQARALARMHDDLPGQGQTIQHLKTTANENSSLFQMIYACRNRFKPIYDELIMPIVRLSKLGYDYQGEQLSERERQHLTGPFMKQWLGLMHVCELFKNVHIIKAEGPARPNVDEDGLLTEIDSDQERADLHSKPDVRFDYMHPIVYEKTVRNELPEELSIGDESQLDLELSRKQGHLSPVGFHGLVRKVVNQSKKFLAKFDLERFAHYRRNSLWYSGVLNFISSCSNIASITITLYGTFGG